jgi:hypothetical protein
LTSTSPFLTVSVPITTGAMVFMKIRMNQGVANLALVPELNHRVESTLKTPSESHQEV